MPELTAEDCEPTASTDRRLTADWDTNYELRTTGDSKFVPALAPQYVLHPQLVSHFAIAVGSQSSVVSPVFAALRCITISNHDRSPRDVEDDSANPSRVIRCEKQRRARDILRPPQALYRVHVEESLLLRI